MRKKNLKILKEEKKHRKRAFNPEDQTFKSRPLSTRRNTFEDSRRKEQAHKMYP